MVPVTGYLSWFSETGVVWPFEARGTHREAVKLCRDGHGNSLSNTCRVTAMVNLWRSLAVWGENRKSMEQQQDLQSDLFGVCK